MSPTSVLERAFPLGACDEVLGEVYLTCGTTGIAGLFELTRQRGGIVMPSVMLAPAVVECVRQTRLRLGDEQGRPPDDSVRVVRGTAAGR